MFARALPLSLSTLLLAACTGSTSSAPSNGTDPSSDPSSVETSPPVTPAPPVAADASLPPPAPSFIVPSEELERGVPGEPAGQSPLYRASLDATTLEEGRASMLLAAMPDATSATFAATTAVRPIDGTVVGRRYRMRARIKTEEATKAFLWWRIDFRRLGRYKLDNMGSPADRRISGTQNWQEVALVMDVPEGARAFAFGSGLRGQGKVWVGAITFEEVGADVPTTPSIDSEQE